MHSLSTNRPPRLGVNNHPIRGLFVGAVLGGLGMGLAIGGPLFVLSLLLSAHSSEGMSSAHGMSIGEIAVILLLGSISLGPLSALAGTLGGAIPGATNKPTAVGIAQGAIVAALFIGTYFVLWIGNSGEKLWDTGMMITAYFLGGLLGAIGGGIVAAIGGAVRKRSGAI